MFSISLNTGIDTQLKFTLEPIPGSDDAFPQWLDAMRGVCRLPCGIPPEFRKKVIITILVEKKKP